MTTTHEVAGRVFVITGAAAGIGAAQARAFLEEGAKHVAVLDVAKAAGIAFENELNKEFGAGKAKFFKVDVTNDDEFLNALKKTSEEQKQLDCLINNAGIMNDSPKSYKKMIEVNVTALVSGSLMAYELMRADHGGAGGTIINIASTGAINATHVMPIYQSTKSAVLMFSKSLGMMRHYSRSRVRVMVVGFHGTDTSLVHPDKFGAIDEETRAELAEGTKTTYLQTAESGANAVKEAYKQGETASMWMGMNDEGPKNITQNIDDGYATFTRGLFD